MDRWINRSIGLVGTFFLLFLFPKCPSMLHLLINQFNSIQSRHHHHCCCFCCCLLYFFVVVVHMDPTFIVISKTLKRASFSFSLWVKTHKYINKDVDFID
jgi:hypothetical protein